MTFYRSSIDTISLNCLVFEKIAIFRILATDRQMDKQVDIINVWSRSLAIASCDLIKNVWQWRLRSMNFCTISIHTDYKNRILADQTWACIASEIGIEGELCNYATPADTHWCQIMFYSLPSGVAKGTWLLVSPIILWQKMHCPQTPPRLWSWTPLVDLHPPLPPILNSGVTPLSCTVWVSIYCL